MIFLAVTAILIIGGYTIRRLRASSDEAVYHPVLEFLDSWRAPHTRVRDRDGLLIMFDEFQITLRRVTGQASSSHDEALWELTTNVWSPDACLQVDTDALLEALPIVWDK